MITPCHHEMPLVATIRAIAAGGIASFLVLVIPHQDARQTMRAGKASLQRQEQIDYLVQATLSD